MASEINGDYVLVVEDDQCIGQLLVDVLAECGLPARVARTGHQALIEADAEQPSLVLLDLGLPGLYGTSVAVILRRHWPKLPIIIMSALSVQAVSRDAWSIGAAAYFTKPFDCWAVVGKVQELLAGRTGSPAPV